VGYLCPPMVTVAFSVQTGIVSVWYTCYMKDPVNYSTIHQLVG